MEPPVCFFLLLWSKHVFLFCACVLLPAHTSGIWIRSCSWADLPVETFRKALQHGARFLDIKQDWWSVYHCTNHPSYLITFSLAFYWLVEAILSPQLANAVYNLCALTHDILNNWLKWCAKQTKGHLSPSAALSHHMLSFLCLFKFHLWQTVTCASPIKSTWEENHQNVVFWPLKTSIILLRFILITCLKLQHDGFICSCMINRALLHKHTVCTIY